MSARPYCACSSPGCDICHPPAAVETKAPAPAPLLPPGDFAIAWVCEHAMAQSDRHVIVGPVAARDAAILARLDADIDAVLVSDRPSLGMLLARIDALRTELGGAK